MKTRLGEKYYSLVWFYTFTGGRLEESKLRLAQAQVFEFQFGLWASLGNICKLRKDNSKSLKDRQTDPQIGLQKPLGAEMGRPAKSNLSLPAIKLCADPYLQ